MNRTCTPEPQVSQNTEAYRVTSCQEVMLHSVACTMFTDMFWTEFALHLFVTDVRRSPPTQLAHFLAVICTRCASLEVEGSAMQKLTRISILVFSHLGNGRFRDTCDTQRPWYAYGILKEYSVNISVFGTTDASFFGFSLTQRNTRALVRYPVSCVMPHVLRLTCAHDELKITRTRSRSSSTNAPVG